MLKKALIYAPKVCNCYVTLKLQNYPFQAHFYGLCSYPKGLQIQAQIKHEIIVQKTSSGFILGFEHPCCITRGRRSHGTNTSQNLGAEKSAGQQPAHNKYVTKNTQKTSPPYPTLRPIDTIKNWPVFNTERGGLLTLHNPGQLVIYPVVDLRKWGLGARKWCELLLQTTQSFLQNLGVPCEFKTTPPGVYTPAHKMPVGKSLADKVPKDKTLSDKMPASKMLDAKMPGYKTPRDKNPPGKSTQNKNSQGKMPGGKIAFVGLKISQGVSTHGVAINIKNNLDDFKCIHPCGHSDLPIDRVANHIPNHNHNNLDMKNLFDLWVQTYQNLLKNSLN